MFAIQFLIYKATLGNQIVKIQVIAKQGHAFLKLMCTNLHYHVVGTCTASIVLSNDHSLYTPITSDEYQT